MPTVQIADDLDIITEVIQTNPVGRMGVEISQPVIVLGDDVVSVTGEVLTVQAPGGVLCYLEVYQSWNARDWSFAQRVALPTPPAVGPFALTNVSVSFLFARVRWKIEGPMDASTRWQVSATLASGESGS